MRGPHSLSIRPLVTGFATVCGTLLAKDLCHAVGIDPVDLGGLMKPVQEV